MITRKGFFSRLMGAFGGLIGLGSLAKGDSVVVREFPIPSPAHPERINAYSIHGERKPSNVVWSVEVPQKLLKFYTYGSFTWDKKSGEPISAHLFRDYKTYQQEKGETK